jgi:ubiquinone/menaquinone biosynthesis C-methylase UbiE
VATVFMKWLERSPRQYDRGIKLLTLGHLSRFWDQICEEMVSPGTRILELGCGTGGLTLRMANAGAEVNAIDSATGMLSIAIDSAQEAGISNQIHFERMDATQIGEHFSKQSFDLIVASLMMSELTPQERVLVLEACTPLIKTKGKLVLLDEVIPDGIFKQIRYYLLRVPLALVTWILTRTSTRPLFDVQTFLEKQGYSLVKTTCALGGSLCLISASPPSQNHQARQLFHVERLQHGVSLKNSLIDLWALFFRILPPYPKVRPGLYSIGHPSPDSPVLVTGNFDLTVRRLLKALDGKLDAWLLVVDSGGINVWCASGGGFLTSDKIIAALHASRLENVVSHRQLVLPQLSAVGVDGNEIRQKTDWSIDWGPVRAVDVPKFVEDGFQKSEDMRSVHFPVLDRLEMVSGTLGFYGLLLLVPVAIFWRSSLLPIAIAMIGLSYFYALIMPWLPGKDGLRKSVSITVTAIVGVIAFSMIWDSVPPRELFNRIMGITALSVFIAGEFQGMSPLMRGEQANWVPEAMIAFILGLIYWLFPKLVGWS